MNLRLLVFLFPLLIFSQSKKDQISSLERKLAILKVENFELQEELDNCSDSQISLSSEKKNLQLELKSKIDSINSIKINLQNKIDSIIDLYEEEEYRFNMLNKEFYYIEGQIEIKDSLIENLELENNELKNKLNNKSDIKDDVLSDSFLNNLYHGKEEINNQTFYLSFEGILNIEECTLPYGSGYGSNDNYYDNRNRGVFYSFLPVEDLIVNFYKSDLSKIDSFNDEDDCKCADDPIVYKKNNRLKGVLPELSFLKGKLVTINTFSDQLEVDYLFSTSIDDVSKGVLYKKMHFRFTREAGNGKEEETFFVPIRVINGRVFLLLTNSFLKKLDFGFHFTSFPCPEIDDGDYGVFDENYNSEDPWMVETIEGETKEFWYDPGYYSSDTFDNVRCLRPDLIQVFKKKDNFNSEQKIIHLKQSDIFLFELIEK